MSRRLAVAATCAVALTLTGSVPAHADSITTTDRSGDVWALNTGPGPSDHTRVPKRRQADIRRTVIDHRAHRVVIRTSFFELRRQGRYLNVAGRLRTNTGLVRYASVLAGPRSMPHRWRGRSFLARRAGAKPTDCSTRHRINYTTNRVVLRIPRTCLGNPRWVQGGFGVATLTGNQFYADDAASPGPAARFRGYGRRIPRATIPVEQSP